MFNINKWAGAAIAVMSMAFATTVPATAQNLLQDIQSRGKIVVAIDLGNPPFAITNAEQKPEGADVDVATQLAQDLGVELEIIPVQGPNRIPFLVTGKADIVVAAFSITPERAKSVNFSNPTGSLKVTVFAPKSVDISSIDDLAGKSIGVTRSSIQDTDLTARAPEGTTITRFDEDALTTAAFLAGQVDAFATSNHLGKAIAERNPGAEMEPKFLLRELHYAIGIRQGEPDFLRWVNTWIFTSEQNGKLGEIYQRWMGEELAPLPRF